MTVSEYGFFCNKTSYRKIEQIQERSLLIVYNDHHKSLNCDPDTSVH